MKEKIMDFLLNNSDPSIVLRIKKELLNNLSAKDESELLSEIILQTNIQTVIQSQKSDGWFGNHFHGASAKFGAGMFDNMEVGLRYLAEKGFPAENEYISKAVNSFLLKDPLSYDVYRIKQPNPPGTDYTTTAFGIYFIRCSLIVRAGHEFLFPENEFINIKHDIDFSLKTFLNVLNYENIDDVIDRNRKKLCFKPNILWPCIYDLRVLAHSQGWRNDKNVSLLADSVNHLFSFPQSGDCVYSYRKGQYYSPCGAFIHYPILDGDSSSNGVIGSDWLDVMELFARCGMINQVKVLKNEYNSLVSALDENLNINLEIRKHRNEFLWGCYGGIALEQDWKTAIRKTCDLLFRILLIIHYAERT
jgi:hypothetical protein